jgi:gluconokinase
VSAAEGLVLVLTGVSGAGKTTIGAQLAQQLRFEFYEGDDYHPQANKAKMHAGVPLNDEDREPWLQQIRALIDGVLARKGDAVVTCSALKHAYRDRLRRPGVQLVYLRISPEVARQRLRTRTGHFFDSRLLDSQFATLEEPHDAIIVDASQAPAKIVEQLVQTIGTH